jgi:hypothetical protein
MSKFLLMMFLTMAIVPKPIKMPEDIKKFCAEKPRECGT